MDLFNNKKFRGGSWMNLIVGLTKAYEVEPRASLTPRERPKKVGPFLVVKI